MMPGVIVTGLIGVAGALGALARYLLGRFVAERVGSPFPFGTLLINISGDVARLEVLCRHKTSWHTQSSHCHPTWSWDGSRILYASDYGGKVNLYLLTAQKEELVEAYGRDVIPALREVSA